MDLIKTNVGIAANPESELNPWIESYPRANGVYEAKLVNGAVVVICRVRYDSCYVYNTIEVIQQKEDGTYGKVRVTFDTRDVITLFANDWIENNVSSFRPIILFDDQEK